MSRKRIRRWLWISAGILAGAMAWLMFFPVPVGWALHLAARLARPPGGSVGFELGAATLRWRWGEPDLRLTLARLAIRAEPETFVAVESLTLEISKPELWLGQFAPRRLEAVAPRVALDLSPGAKGARWFAALDSKPARAAPSHAPFAPLAAFLPTELQPMRIRLDGLRVALRNLAGAVDWEIGPVETTAVRRGMKVRVEFAAALAGVAPAAAIALQAEMPVDGATLGFSLRVPPFSTTRLRPWPGAPVLPLQATVALDARGEIDLARERVRSVSGGFSISDATLIVPGWEAPIPVARLEMRGRAQGNPLAFEFEPGRIEVAGARLDLERLSGTLGAQPSFAWQLAMGDVAAARLIALLPAELRSRLPGTAEARAALRFTRLHVAGETAMAKDPAGRWRPASLAARGEIRADNRGVPFALTWEARQRDSGAVAILAEVAPFRPAQWAWCLGNSALAAAANLPVSAQLAAELGADGTLDTATMDLSGGVGNIAAWGPLPRSLFVRSLSARAEVANGGRLLRLPKARIELDGPVATIEAAEVALPAGGPIDARGEIVVENLSAPWVEPWLPPGALETLRAWGVSGTDWSIARVAARGSVRLGAGVEGNFQPQGAEAVVRVGARVHELPVDFSVGATLDAAADRLDATVDLAGVSLAKTFLILPAGLPPPATFDFPVSARLSANASAAGALRRATVALRAGPGRVRASSLWGAEVPFREFSAVAGMAGDFRRIEVRSLEAELGAGLQLRGRNLAWDLGGVQRAGGELELAPCDLPPLFALLPPELESGARRHFQAGRLGGARLEIAGTAIPTRPGGWRIDRLRGDAAVEEIRLATTPGEIFAVKNATLSVDYPRATLGIRDATAPAFFRGPVDFSLAIDATVPTALRAEATLDASRARFLAPGLADVVIAAAPLKVTVSAIGEREARFGVEAPSVLGRPLKITGRMAAGGAGLSHGELSELVFGRTVLRAQFRRPSPDRVSVAMESARLDVDEILRAAAPFLGLSGVAPAPRPFTGEVPPPPPALSWDFDVGLAAVELGEGRSLRDFRVQGKIAGRWPESLLVRGTEGAGNALRAALGGGAASQAVAFSADDASAWLAALLTPLRTTPLPAGAAALIGLFRPIPNLVAGGSVELEGVLAGRREFTGRFKLGRAVFVQPPRILQLLALKSGATAASRPVLEKFSVDRIVANATTLTLDGLVIAGSGLIDRLNVRSASYQMGNGQLAVDGAYFGVGFVVVGTRANPQVYLDDKSLLIRAFGRRPEFDFEAMAEESRGKSPKGTPTGASPR